MVIDNNDLSAGERLALSFGYLTLNEASFLREICMTLPPEPVIINIGAGSGTSSLVAAEARPDARIYTIDISGGGWMGGLLNEVNAFRDAGLLHLLPNQILDDSHHAGHVWAGGQADLIIIDADHSESGCRGDYEAWNRHCKVGGILLFHDYEREEWPAVRLVVDEVMVEPCWGLIDQVDTYRAFRRLAC
jgi:hypothetical protein